MVGPKWEGASSTNLGISVQRLRELVVIDHEGVVGRYADGSHSGVGTGVIVEGCDSASFLELFAVPGIRILPKRGANGNFSFVIPSKERTGIQLERRLIYSYI